MPFKDPERRRQYQRDWYLARREAILADDAKRERDRQWKAANPDRIQIHNTRYYAERRLREHGLI